ncbi:hypothetical protein LUZ62_051851 [Rhynchospora pubera]|uniref:protein-serine/threonine phosphatase n=1 Tax=Rhynchospora pubera TaxID=906938 RepID=A0AAV8G8S2_9POAL|nr:hypothetical protein LUZ62_081566 [Rhynchospora pubera]KAJ4800605.1 hypothetical protein LUZ62_051851 [Rhynchospora pubera]
MAGIGTTVRMSSDRKQDSINECRDTPLRHTATSAGMSAAASGSGTSAGTTDDRPGQRKRTRDDEDSRAEVAGGPSGSGEPGEVGVVPHPIVVPRPVAFGYVSVAGRLREMEDAVCVKTRFFQLPNGSYMHFFAVFDGHGGSHIAELCKSNMHLILAEELAAVMLGDALTSSSQGTLLTMREEDTKWRKALTESFARMDAIAVTACACGRVGLPICTCELSGRVSPIVGSTAVVGLVTDDRVLIANCGDSRAVLGRGGRAYAVSCDHKPDRPDELARIEAAGGRVIYNNGARVSGILAMSRALGDRFLKPEVISEPDIRTIRRTDQDEFLILASDGLWDVLSNEMACNVVRQSLDEADPAEPISLSAPTDPAEAVAGPSEPATTSPQGEELQQQEHAQGCEEQMEPRCRMASAILARLALGRGSADNISVIVVDLRKA